MEAITSVEAERDGNIEKLGVGSSWEGSQP